MNSPKPKAFVSLSLAILTKADLERVRQLQCSSFAPTPKLCRL
jgi:hypothetical protein